MRKIQELDGGFCIDKDDLQGAALYLYQAGDIVGGFVDGYHRERTDDEINLMVLEHPVLTVGMAALAMLEKLGDDYLQSQNEHNLLLQEIAESLGRMDTRLEGNVIATNPDADDEAETARHAQAAQDYDRLKWLLHKAMPIMDEAEYREAQAFIQRLSGL